MKIDKVYISCSKVDFYFTKVCVASIRYWNDSVPVFLIKDFSLGNFDSTELEVQFNVGIADFRDTNFGYYNKLLPFLSGKNERFFLIDSDTVWLGDLVSFLELFSEDLITAKSLNSEIGLDKNNWFFDPLLLQQEYGNYKKPDFLFNSGQIVATSSKFCFKDFEKVLISEELPKPSREDIFVGEDQGILNYIVANKIEKRELTFREVDFMINRWSEEINVINFSDVLNKKDNSFLVHWIGPKKGFFFFLPQWRLLNFFENYYYSRVTNGKQKRWRSNTERILKNFFSFIFEAGKKMFYTVKNLNKKGYN